MYARTLYYIHENERWKTIDFSSHLAKGTRFLRHLQPFRIIFLSLILFLINRIGYSIDKKADKGQKK